VAYRQPRSGFTRVPFIQTCRLRSGEDDLRAMVCNLSLLGLFVHLETPPEVGTECEVSLSLPDGGLPMQARAVVTWVQRDPPRRAADLPIGCGLRFVSVEPEDVRRMAALIAQFGPDSPQVGINQPTTGHVRIPFVTGCTLATPQGELRGSLCNLSTRGVYVAVDPVPDLDTSVLVSFQLPDDDEPFERGAVCAWINSAHAPRMRALPPGCGLRFVGLSAADVARLEQVVADYLAAHAPV